jgi:hypothetical protein
MRHRPQGTDRATCGRLLITAGGGVAELGPFHEAPVHLTGEVYREYR